MVENLPASAGDTREAGLILEVENGTPTPEGPGGLQV